ncbi:winged helix-turn-helix domain-containing protein [Kribbella sp. NPDC056861]|uniref:winged helix-turn-helix domain-containing protein n=1 Tax=Kribbella sp. NPDC056861 TaxID=3154857 RepID=UPI003424A343
MGIWRINADLLARSSFGLSEMVETVGALRLLAVGQTQPWQREWRDRHLPAFQAMLDALPVTAAIAEHSFGPGWTADFLTRAPRRLGLPFEAELETFGSYTDDQLRTHLYDVRQAKLPPILTASSPTDRVLVDAAAELVSWVWTQTVQPDWDRRRRVLRSDVVARTSRLATGGWSSVIDDMRPGMRWLGGGELQINTYGYPPQDLHLATDLYFIPAHCPGRGWSMWDEKTRFGIVYPVTGVFTQDLAPTPDALANLLGRGRATLLTRLDSPMSTTQLVALTGMSLGAVGDHLKTLREAGAIQRRRSAREVLYWRTTLGDLLLSQTQ